MNPSGPIPEEELDNLVRAYLDREAAAVEVPSRLARVEASLRSLPDGPRPRILGLHGEAAGSWERPRRPLSSPSLAAWRKDGSTPAQGAGPRSPHRSSTPPGSLLPHGDPQGAGPQ